MVSLCILVSIFHLILLINPISSQQSYDITKCSATNQIPGSNYLCNSNTSCDTFIVYRAQDGYQTLSSIASLFNTGLKQLLSSNKMSKSNSNHLQLGQEIIIPINCSCPDRFSHSIFLYNASHKETSYSVACVVYEGLVKEQVFLEENPNFNANVPIGSLSVQVPIRCACPEVSDIENGINYLVTYPIIEDDHTDLIAAKFGVPETMIWSANRLGSFETIYPQTTLLIPTKEVPVLNLNLITQPDVPSPSPKPVTLYILPGNNESNNKKLFVPFIGGLSAAFVLIILACWLLVFIRRKNHPSNFQPLSVKSSQLSNFSPDLLDGMSKLKNSLISFTLEELMIATEDFSEASVIGTAVYRGRIGGSHLAIERMCSEEAAHHVIGILSKTNHLNVVKLEGCCYGNTGPYLVYEFAEKGSLRDSLSNEKIAKQLKWATRMQIAFDLAVGLHYIHCCTKPAYLHRNINSKNVLITRDWRAKISGFRLAKPLIYREEKEDPNWNESVIVGRKGYLAPEYLTCGQASTKVDVYAFGVVLLELLSAKEAVADGNLLKDSTNFLTDKALEDSSGCLEKLKRFMDPALEGNYPLGEAMCMALLAKGCLEEDPLHRPTMNDVLKAFFKNCLTNSGL